jgi:hypothetical protein
MGLQYRRAGGTVTWSYLLYDDKEDRLYSRLSHSASYDGGPEYRWQWGVMVPQRHLCVKVHLDGKLRHELPSVALHPGEVVVVECLRPSRTVYWGGTTRRAMLIDAVELTAPANGQVSAPAEPSGHCLEPSFELGRSA